MEGGWVIKRLFERFLELSLPIKLVLGAFLGVVAGPGLIGFLSEYATYIYALRVGIRPPLEGIPYLSVAVTAGSLFLAFVAASIFIVVRIVVASIVERMIYAFDYSFERNAYYFIFRFIFNRSIGGGDKLEIVNKIRSINFGAAIILSFVVSFSFGLSLYLFEVYNPVSREKYPFLMGGIGFGLAFFAFLTLWREASIYWVALGSSLLFYAVSFYFIFSIDHYSSFLRAVGYGGGAKVSVEYVLKGNDVGVEEVYLLLRTSESLIALKEDKKTVTEVPIGNVFKINYIIGDQRNNYFEVSNLNVNGGWWNPRDILLYYFP